MAQFALRDALVQFLVDNPKVDIIQHVTNRAVDLVEGGFDMAIRAHTGRLPDSSLIQRRLAPAPWHLFAGPAYLESAGVPTSPEALDGHTGLKLGFEPERGSWSLRSPDGVTATVPYQPRLCSDDMVTLKHAATEGLGIVGLPGYICRDDVGVRALGSRPSRVDGRRCRDQPPLALTPRRHAGRASLGRASSRGLPVRHAPA